jgi:hypothetical protein
MNVRFTVAADDFWGAHVSRVLVSTSRRNKLSGPCRVSSVTNALRKVRACETRALPGPPSR